MRKWNVVALLLALGLTAPAFAQQDELKKQVEELQRQVAELRANQTTLAAENAELKASSTSTSLEERINGLSDSLDYAGTTVKSRGNVDSITLFGSARIRSGWTFDRDFGQDFANSDLEDDDGSFTDARFNLGFDFQVDPDVKTRISMQSNGLYENGDTPGDEGLSQLSEVDLYEAYIEWTNIFGRRELGSRDGRQEIVLGNEFQFGNNDYFSGETFDASHWWWNAETWELHFLWAKMAITDSFNTRNHPYVTSGVGNGYDDDELYSLYFSFKGWTDHVIDLYWIYFNGHNGGSLGTLGNALGSSSTGDSGVDGGGFDFYYHTLGLRIAGVFAVAAGLDYNLEFAYQTGDLSGTGAGVADNVDNFALEGEIGLTFSEEHKFRVYIRGMYAEGANGDETGYIPLFPERHSQSTVAGVENTNNHTRSDKLNGVRRARYGVMDIIPMDNVWSVQLGMTFDPSADWTLGLTGLYAEHDEEVAVLGGTTDDGIGFEIDAFAEYRYTKHATLGGGIGVLFPDDGAPLTNGGFVGQDDDVAFLFFLQARVVF